MSMLSRTLLLIIVHHLASTLAWGLRLGSDEAHMVSKEEQVKQLQRLMDEAQAADYEEAAAADYAEDDEFDYAQTAGLGHHGYDYHWEDQPNDACDGGRDHNEEANYGHPRPDGHGHSQEGEGSHHGHHQNPNDRKVAAAPAAASSSLLEEEQKQDHNEDAGNIEKAMEELQAAMARHSGKVDRSGAAMKALGAAALRQATAPPGRTPHGHDFSHGDHNNGHPGGTHGFRPFSHSFGEHEPGHHFNRKPLSAEDFLAIADEESSSSS